ncbi:hypothetical protein [Massilia timonae]|uniref:hypothetical protein n=1 Tax=Massilia timonae TaxID=47229 RepID=UPI0028D6994A|nr:hypothetical protein [Massilia timonae]
MGKHINPVRTAVRGTPAYAAGEYLYKNGATSPRQLFAAVDFGGKSTPPEEALQRSLAYGWLIEREGKIDISTYARGHFDKLAGIEPVQPVGQIAAVRTSPDVFTRPPLSKKYIPNPRGTRQDIPAWSVRTGASFHTKA